MTFIFNYIILSKLVMQTRHKCNVISMVAASDLGSHKGDRQMEAGGGGRTWH